MTSFFFRSIRSSKFFWGFGGVFFIFSWFYSWVFSPNLLLNAMNLMIQAETVPVVKPLLNDMTLSELHAVMTNGFATVSGGTLIAYILYGVGRDNSVSQRNGT